MSYIDSMAGLMMNLITNQDVTPVHFKIHSVHLDDLPSYDKQDLNQLHYESSFLEN